MDSFDDLFTKVELFYASQAETFGGLPKDAILPLTNEEITRHFALNSSTQTLSEKIEAQEESVDYKISNQENQTDKIEPILSDLELATASDLDESEVTKDETASFDAQQTQDIEENISSEENELLDSDSEELSLEVADLEESTSSEEIELSDSDSVENTLEVDELEEDISSDENELSDSDSVENTLEVDELEEDISSDENELSDSDSVENTLEVDDLEESTSSDENELSDSDLEILSLDEVDLEENTLSFSIESSEPQAEILDFTGEVFRVKNKFVFEGIIEEKEETTLLEAPVLSLEEEIEAKNEVSEDDDEDLPKRDKFTIDMFGEPEPSAKKESVATVLSDSKEEVHHEKNVLALHIPIVSPVSIRNSLQDEIELEILSLISDEDESESFEINPNEPILFDENENSALEAPKTNNENTSLYVDEKPAQSPDLEQTKGSELVHQTENTEINNSVLETPKSSKENSSVPLDEKFAQIPVVEQTGKSTLVHQTDSLKVEPAKESPVLETPESSEKNINVPLDEKFSQIPDLAKANESEDKNPVISQTQVENSNSDTETKSNTETENSVLNNPKLIEEKANISLDEKPAKSSIVAQREIPKSESSSISTAENKSTEQKTESPQKPIHKLIEDDSELQVSLDDDDNYVSSNKVYIAPTYIPLKHISPMQLHVQLSQCTTLDELKALCEIHSDLLKTDLEATNLVFGSGNPKAKLVIVGEAPGANEDLTGEPFVGKAGQLLDKILAAINLDRSEIYIANILKHRPPQNRDPLPEERDRSLPFLIRQIEIIQPKLVLCLGRISAKTLLGLPNSIKLSDIRGKFHPFLRGMELTATYHPSSLMRNPAWKKAAWDDVKMVRAKYDSEKP